MQNEKNDLVQPAAESTPMDIHPDLAANGVEASHEQEEQQHVITELNNLKVGAEHAGHNTPVPTIPSMVSLPNKEIAPPQSQPQIQIEEDERNDAAAKWDRRFRERQEERRQRNAA